jgi:hypothetical protein
LLKASLTRQDVNKLGERRRARLKNMGNLNKLRVLHSRNPNPGRVCWPIGPLDLACWDSGPWRGVSTAHIHGWEWIRLSLFRMPLEQIPFSRSTPINPARSGFKPCRAAPGICISRGPPRFSRYILFESLMPFLASHISTTYLVRLTAYCPGCSTRHAGTGTPISSESSELKTVLFHSTYLGRMLQP